jgi:single-strand DNA-binding protein
MHKYPSVNKVFISGELVETPSYATSYTGDEVVNFVIISKKRFRSTRTQEMKQKSCLVQITAWGNLAETCKQHLSRGSIVFVTGEIEQSTWRGPEGDKRIKLYVVAEKVDFIENGQQTRDASGTEDVSKGEAL